MLGRRAKICTSVGVRNIEVLGEKVEEAFSLSSDLVELRIDYLDRIDFPTIREAIKEHVGRCILTCRTREEGGEFKGGEDERQKLLQNLSKLRPAYMDVELSLAQSNPRFLSSIKSSGASLIVSYHNFKNTPSLQSLKSTLDEAKPFGEIVKIVTMAKVFLDNITILKLYKSSKPDKLVAFCMGEKGQISRILCPIIGSPFTYASLPDSPTAPAQINTKELRVFYDLL
ncbi:MAG: type I 3-dehydroquinate dehydratase [Nitrososphaerales archaeon]|nr:type I 3-dehydroquinate dehydratase [Nitrososphaerales archaeon]